MSSYDPTRESTYDGRDNSVRVAAETLSLHAIELRRARQQRDSALHRAEELATHAEQLLRELGHRAPSGALSMRQERTADRVQQEIDKVKLER